MNVERLVQCGNVAERRRSLRKREPLRLRMWGDGANVSLKIERFRRSMQANLEPAFLDLLDVATYVYCADGAVKRANGGDVDGGDKRGGRIGDGWRRRLHFRVPVRRPDLWRTADVQEALCETLAFLSDDDYSFEFEPFADGEKTLQSYLSFDDDPFEGRIEEVALFSGGLDSLAGAVREIVVDKREVALVGHRSTSKTSGTAEALVAGLSRRTARPPVHLPFRVNKAKALGREFTQRSRSFLFASLAAVVAVTANRPRVRFYENGVVSMNLPLAAEVVGARATRTTHPRVLNGFQKLFAQVAGSDFRIEAPFFRMTKTDVVRSIADAGCADLIAESRSCAHTIAATTEHPHCGTCSQCIDRRFATFAAGQEAFDSPIRYAVDPLTGAHDDEASRAMIAAYVNTATRIDGMSPEAFFGEFGEAFRALRYLEGGAERAASDVYQLFKRHASQVCGVVDATIRRHASSIRTSTVPTTSLVGLAFAGRSLLADEAAPPAVSLVASEFADEPNLLRREGEFWSVRFRGGARNLIKHSVGMEYLAVLLSHPGQETPIEELEREVRRHDEAAKSNSGGAVTDREALASYNESLAELRRELENAERDGDEAEATRITNEIETIQDEIGNSFANGALREFASERENTRKRVGAAIDRVVKAIGKFDSALAKHLAPPTLVRGFQPCYRPADGIDWHLSDSRNSAALREK